MHSLEQLGYSFETVLQKADDQIIHDGIKLRLKGEKVVVLSEDRGFALMGLPSIRYQPMCRWNRNTA